MSKAKLIATEKSVGYAYPSSPMAEECGKGKEGCYFLETVNDTKRVALLAIYDDRADAFRDADKLELPYSRWSLTKKGA